MTSRLTCNPNDSNSTSSNEQADRDAFKEKQLLYIVLHNGRTLLYPLQIKFSQTDATIMQRLQKKYKGISPSRCWFEKRILIEDAIVSKMCFGDTEAQDFPREVIIESSTSCVDLTEAFARPSALRGSSLVSKDSHFVTDTNHKDRTRVCHAILIRTAACTSTVAIVLTLVVLFSGTAGLIAGFLAKDAKLGVAVCAGLIGIFALLQASQLGMDSLKLKTTT